jgi:hypothetical protein
VVLVVLLAVLAAGGPWSSRAHANGDGSFSLQRFSFRAVASVTDDLRIAYRWRVTVCTARRARLRISAIVVTDFGPERNRFVRRQGAGCTRHRLRALGENLFEEEAVSMLRVAWRSERRHTRWLSAGDPAPD